MKTLARLHPLSRYCLLALLASFGCSSIDAEIPEPSADCLSAVDKMFDNLQGTGQGTGLPESPPPICKIQDSFRFKSTPSTEHIGPKAIQEALKNGRWTVAFDWAAWVHYQGGHSRARQLYRETLTNQWFVTYVRESSPLAAAHLYWASKMVGLNDHEIHVQLARLPIYKGADPSSLAIGAVIALERSIPKTTVALKKVVGSARLQRAQGEKCETYYCERLAKQLQRNWEETF